MASYVIVGASKGLGYEHLRQLSANPANTVIGLVRDKGAVDALVQKDNLANVHILTGDLTKPDELAAAAKETSRLANGKVDVLIVNGAYISGASSGVSPTSFTSKEDMLGDEVTKSVMTNVVGPMYAINSFLPLVRAGQSKKIIVISSAMGDTKFNKAIELAGNVPYSISKAAVNMVVMKYAIELKSEGIVVLAISPGLVGTTEDNFEQRRKLFVPIFQKYNPNFESPITSAESVSLQHKVIDNVTIEDSGEMLSHFGTEQWL